MKLWHALACVFLFTVAYGSFSKVFGQTATSLNLSGLTTNTLTHPDQPDTFSSPGCGAGASSWQYSIVAYDAANGSTEGSTPTGTTNNCTNLTPTSPPKYVTFKTKPVAGAVSCGVYRTTVAGTTLHTGFLGLVHCGAYFYDDGTLDGHGEMQPSTNTTGSVSASGSVTAASFTASTGTSAGTTIWNTGGPLAQCDNTHPQPCILSTNQFFLQAHSGSMTSFGFTAPNAANGALGPLIAGAPGGTPSASQLYFGTLTDSDPMAVPAIVTANGNSFPTNNNLTKVVTGLHGADLADSGITLTGGGQIPNSGLANSSMIVGTSSPLGGGGSVSLGGSLSLTIANATSSTVGAIQLAGDLGGISGTNPSVLKVHGATYPAPASANQVPVSTSSSAVTYEAVPNAALANSAVTVPVTSPITGGGSVSLGGSATSIACPTCATGPGSSTANDIVSFNGTDGITLKDSGISAAASSMWFSVKSGGSTSVSFSTTANTANLYCIVLETPITVNHIGYYIFSSGDNTNTNNYDLGLYTGSPGGSGTLAAHTGSITGQTLTHNGASGTFWNQALTSGVTIQRGPVCLAISTSCTGGSCNAIGGTSTTVSWNLSTAYSTGSGTSGALPLTLTLPSFIPITGLVPAWILYNQ